MKKFYMMLAAVAAMTFTAQAQAYWDEIQVGDFENATEFFGGSYWDSAPTTFYLAHTGVQMIYTTEELAAVQGTPYVDIMSLTFKMCNEGAFEEMTRDVKIYMQAIDETQFAVVDGVKQFFNFENLVYSGQETYDLLSYYGDDMEFRYELQVPFRLTKGKNLLVTMVYDAEDDDNCTSSRFDAEFYTSGITGRAMTYTDNWTSFVDYALGEDFPDATAMLGCGTSVDLPVTKIEISFTPPTGIDEVKTITINDDAYYNLMGQKFTGNVPAGIYIHNGKKVLVK